MTTTCKSAIQYILTILLQESLRELSVLMRIVLHSPEKIEHCFLYHLIRPLYLVNIFMTGVYSDIQ